MSHLLTLFANNILPIFLAAGAGFLLSKFKIINPRTVSAVAFYIFSPCLVFTLLTTSPINGDEMTKIVAVTVSTILMLGALVWLIGNALRVERRLLAAVMIAAMFGNAGNYGEAMAGCQMVGIVNDEPAQAARDNLRAVVDGIGKR